MRVLKTIDASRVYTKPVFLEEILAAEQLDQAAQIYDSLNSQLVERLVELNLVLLRVLRATTLESAQEAAAHGRRTILGKRSQVRKPR